MVQTSISILSANFTKLGQEIEAIIDAGADYIHIDVMDGFFVPNLTFGSFIIDSIKQNIPNARMDTHLMISPVENMLSSFITSSSEMITVHLEAVTHLDILLNKIKLSGKKAGIAINPSTPESQLEYLMDVVDLILVMSVNPGMGGQKFIPYSLKKLERIRQMIDKSGRDIQLSIDGGVNADNSKDIINAGADILVIGSAAFKHGPAFYKENIAKIKGMA